MAVVEAFANLTPARAAYRRVFCGVQGCAGVPGTSTGGPPWAGEVVLLLLTIGYVGVVLFLTSRHSLISRSTLAIGTGTGLLLGVVMYLVAPLGLNNYATKPVAAGLRGRPAGGAGLDPAVRRAGRGRRAGQPAPSRSGRRPVALMLESAGLRHWLSHGRQLTAVATYRAEIYAGANVFGYVLIWISFPVIGLIVGAAVASVFADSTPPEASPAAAQEP